MMMDFFSWQNLHHAPTELLPQPAKGLSVSSTATRSSSRIRVIPFTRSSARGRGRRPPLPGRVWDQPAYDNYVRLRGGCRRHYDLTGWANLQAGYGHFFTGSYVEQSLRGIGGERRGLFLRADSVNF